VLKVASSAKSLMWEASPTPISRNHTTCCIVRAQSRSETAPTKSSCAKHCEVALGPGSSHEYVTRIARLEASRRESAGKLAALRGVDPVASAPLWSANAGGFACRRHCKFKPVWRAEQPAQPAERRFRRGMVARKLSAAQSRNIAFAWPPKHHGP
jgi:hypothetical protein